MRIELFILFLSALALMMLYKKRELQKDRAVVSPKSGDEFVYSDSIKQQAA